MYECGERKVVAFLRLEKVLVVKTVGRDAKERSDSRKDNKREDGIQRNCCPIEVKRELNLKKETKGKRETERKKRKKGVEGKGYIRRKSGEGEK